MSVRLLLSERQGLEVMGLKPKCQPILVISVLQCSQQKARRTEQLQGVEAGTPKPEGVRKKRRPVDVCRNEVRT